jgi:hypothetical protein
MAQAFHAEHPAMLDYVALKFELAALHAKNETLHKALMLLLEAVPPYRADGSMMISDAVIEVVNQALRERSGK